MLGLGHEAFFARTWMAAAFSPSSKAMRPASDVETAGEPKKEKKKDIKIQSANNPNKPRV